MHSISGTARRGLGEGSNERESIARVLAEDGIEPEVLPDPREPEGSEEIDSEDESTSTEEEAAEDCGHAVESSPAEGPVAAPASLSTVDATPRLFDAGADPFDLVSRLRARRSDLEIILLRTVRFLTY